MPYKKRKVKGGWQVTGPGGKVKAKKTTLRKAKAMVRLLYGIEEGWEPTGKK